MSTPLIKAVDLTVGWGDVILQQDANFEIPRGDIFVILGRSGCGKSTIMRHLIGLETPLSGQVLYDGTPLTSVEAVKPQFGVMFQSGALFGSMTLGENVALPMQEWTDLPREAIFAIVQAKLRLVGLQGSEEKMPSELSGGMRKRAAIARSMALEPELIFLDEPSAGLDPVTAAELDDLLVTLNEKMGLTLVIVTHDLDSIFRIAKHCIMLDRETKSIIARGDPKKLRESKDPKVYSFFNRETETEASK